jgi:hypothetical protein
MLILNLLKLNLLLHLHLLKVLVDLSLVGFYMLLLLQMGILLFDSRVQGLQGPKTMLYLGKFIFLSIIDH